MFEGIKANRKLDRAYQALEWVNQEVARGQANCDKLQAQLDKLAESIVSIKRAYPELEEKEAVEKYFADLESEIDEATKKLESIVEQLEIAQELKSMKAKKEELEAELLLLRYFKDNKDKIDNLPYYLANLMDEVRTLENRKAVLSQANKKVVDPSKVVIASYALELDGDIADVSPFVYTGDIWYVDEDDDELIGHEYRSLGGLRLAATGHDNISLISSKKKTYNAFFDEYFTLEEVCIAIGSSLYLEDKVTYEEVNRIAGLLREVFFDEDEDYDLSDSLDVLKEKYKGLNFGGRK